MNADMAVHSALVHSVGSPRLDQAYASIVSQMHLVAAQPLDRPSIAKLGRDHKVIASAVTSGDAEAAVREVRAHLEIAMERMLRGLDERAAPAP
jgi:DNA-binding FadR family transcriptional regulator